MREDFKAKWVAALRSGDYMQGRNYLHRDDEFCCLGVACEVLRKDFSEEIHIRVEEEANVVVYEGRNQFLARAIRDFTGLDGNSEGALAVLNDDDGRTFSEIADYIETEF